MCYYVPGYVPRYVPIKVAIADTMNMQPMLIMAVTAVVMAVVARWWCWCDYSIVVVQFIVMMVVEAAQRQWSWWGELCATT